MFIPPWYQPPVVQPISKLATKLPYKKLQYPTNVKNTNPDAHIKIFKKAIKTNGETTEVDIINMFSFTFRDNIFKIS
jgi:hypothetical protein